MVTFAIEGLDRQSYRIWDGTFTYRSKMVTCSGTTLDYDISSKQKRLSEKRST